MLAALLEIGVLAPPAAAAVFVTTNADSGPGSLREAMTTAADGATIQFAPGMTGLTITLASDLPTVTKTLIIDGENLNITIDGNAVARSGLQVGPDGNATVRNLRFEGGFSPSGGEAFAVDQGELTLEKSTLEGHSVSPSPGGPGVSVSHGTLVVLDSTLEGFQSHLGGGAIDATFSDVTLHNIVARNNSGLTGGAVRLISSFATIDESEFSDNEAAHSGGAIVAEADSFASIARSTFSNNSSVGNVGNLLGNGGGAIMVRLLSFALIDESTFDMNHVDTLGDGGAVGVLATASVTATNSTFRGNYISTEGSGGSTYSDGVLFLNSVTITESSFGAGSGLYGGGHGTGSTGFAVIENSILAANTGDDCGSLGTTIIDHTLVQQSTSAIPANSCSVPSDSGNITGVDPLLGTLGGHGGSTETIPLLAGSAAIDAGGAQCPDVDQRGELRSDGACDMGAYEQGDGEVLQAAGLTILSGPCVVYDSDTAGESPFVGGETREVQVTGSLTGQGGASSCVPDGASSVVFTISSIDPLTEGNLLLTPAGVAATGSAGVVNYGAVNGLNNANTVTVPVSAAGAVDVGANAGPAGAVPTTDVRLVAVGFYSPDVDPDLKFFPVNPCAVADSRTNQGADGNFDGPNDDGLWPVNSAFPDVDVVGTFVAGQGGGNTDCGVPAGADAVMVNVVAVNMQGGSGHLSVGAGGSDPVDEATTPFAVLSPKMNNGATTIVNVGAGGTIAIDIDGDPLASTMIRVEILGYYDQDTAGLDFVDVTPCAVFDTRPNQGAAGTFAGERQHGPANTTTYQIAGDAISTDQGGVVDSGGGTGTCMVPSGAQAVLINLEAVNALQEGNFWVSAAGTSTTGGVLNFNNVTPKMNNANAVVVPLSAAGQLDLEINAGNFTPVGTDVAHARGVILGYYN